MRKALWTAVAVVLLTTLSVGQAPDQYLDVFTAQVKPEKRADFDALVKKMVTANHQNNGDTWITMETTYGPGNRVTFISTRKNYADTEKGTDAFYAASVKAYGKAATDKLFADFNQTLVGSTSELRRRRWDLSSNPPADTAAWARMIADARWLRTSVVHVRPGQNENFEALLKEVKAAREKANPPWTTLVSQAVAGQEGIVYYITTLGSSMAAYDNLPQFQTMLGEEGYARYLKVGGEAVSDTQTVISRMLPDMSNAPAEVIAAAPAFWTPKTTVAAKAKAPAVPASSTEKMEEKK
jgi:hypothetical protein